MNALGRRSLAAAVLSIIVAAPVGAPAVAASPGAGWLDPTFGTNGVTLVPRVVARTDDFVTARVAVAPTGRIAVVAIRTAHLKPTQVELTVFTSSGRLDPAFHGGTPLSIFHGTIDEATCCDVEGPFLTPDGGVIVTFGDIDGFAVFRYGPTGRLLWHSALPNAPLGVAVLAGGSTRAISFNFYADLSAPTAVSLQGLTPSGALDTRVGPHGARMLDTLVGPSAIVRDPLNRLYVVGNEYATPPAGDRSFEVFRLTSSGDADPTWGTGGVTTFPGGDHETVDAALAPDYSLYLASQGTDPGTGRPIIVVRKLTSAGIVDGGFGSGGVLVLPAPSGSARFGSITVDLAGRPIVSFVDRASTGLQPMLARLDPATGALDPTFGRSGLMKVASLATGLAVTSGGKVLTVSRVARDGGFVVYLARRTN